MYMKGVLDYMSNKHRYILKIDIFSHTQEKKRFLYIYI